MFWLLVGCLWSSPTTPDPVPAAEVERHRAASEAPQAEEAGSAARVPLPGATARPERVTDVRVVPYFMDGMIGGFRISGIREGSPLAKLDFHDGDVLTAVNGEPLASEERAVALVSALETGSVDDLSDWKDADEVVVTLLRRGVTVTLPISNR